MGFNQDSIVKLLLDYREKNPYSTRLLLKDEEANILNSTDRFAFLLACSIDRQMSFEIVWMFPLWMKRDLGALKPEKLASMSVDGIEAMIRRLPKCHRFPYQAAETIKDLSQKVVSLYNGDASSLWNTSRVGEIKRRLMEIKGVGPGIADMTVNLLLREGWLNLDKSEWRKIDVKPDVHVQRVFYRTGLADSQDERSAALAARLTYPEYPGKLDQPAWQIGLKYCHPSFPSCNSCPINPECLKRGVR